MSAEAKSIKDLRIVFMGTPEFAVASLDALVTAGCQIVGVVTAPDRPAGRGMKLMQSDIKKYAIEKGLTILQPEKLKNPVFLEALKGLGAHVQVVVAFRMLPELVWNMPPMGTINLHGSLLPQYRGAAPIHWAVIQGEAQTGVTTFKLQQAIDTGDVLLQDRFDIGPDETTGDVHDKMKIIGAELLVKTLSRLAAGSIKEQAQLLLADPSDLKHAPKLFTENCQINWNRPVQELHNFIRGLSPFPGALSKLDGKILKIYRSAKEFKTHDLAAGTVVTDGKSYLKFAAVDGFIQLLDLQLEGKKRLLVANFLMGYRPMQDQPI